MILTMITELEVLGDHYLDESTQVKYFRQWTNGIDYILDTYYCNDDWEEIDIEDNVFTFRNTNMESHNRMVLIETSELDKEEQKLFDDIIEYYD